MSASLAPTLWAWRAAAGIEAGKTRRDYALTGRETIDIPVKEGGRERAKK